MSTTPMTARSFLFDERAPGMHVPGLGRALLESEAAQSGIRRARRLTSSVTRTVTEEMGTVADDLLEVDLGDALVAGWKKHRALSEAARRTLASPDSEEVVVLAAHTVTSTYAPAVDLYVDKALVNTFEFQLVVTLVLTGVAAVVRRGDLVSLRGGRCDASVSVSLEGARLVTRKRSLDLQALVILDPPHPLVEKPVVRIPSQPTGSRSAADGRVRP
jgi:hypothetical protein